MSSCEGCKVYAFYKKSDMYMYAACFEYLSSDCPCKECILKMVCEITCDAYKNHFKDLIKDSQYGNSM